ncbi:MAG: hypothetical protein KF726_06165 [Anaerolineae bacterium]|nr:hypothetical protein [Anaerolineae bacterium]
MISPSPSADDLPDSEVAALERQLEHLRSSLSEAQTYARLLEQENLSLRNELEQAASYARILEDEDKRLRQVWAEATAYARSLEARIVDLQAHIRQYQDMR